MSAFVRVWRYRVDAARRGEFERRYGADGDWARLFARGDGYLGTRLLRDVADPARYVTLDRWRSAGDWQAFAAAHGAAYAALDRECDALTGEETDLGDYVELDD